METLRRFGGVAGVMLALTGAGITYFLPDDRAWGWVVLGAGSALAAVALYLNREDLRNLVKGRPFRHGTNALFYSLFVLGIVAAVDFLSARHAHRFDLTEQRIHSLSPQTVQILEGLDQDVSIVAFYAPTSAGRQRAIDLLEEYRHRSPRVSVRVVDPDRSPGEARAYKIEQYGTVVVSCEAGEARITPVTLNEEDLTNALLKATSRKKNVVCVLAGHGERRIDERGPKGFQQAAEALRREGFEVKEIRLLEGEADLSACSCLIVGGPTHALLDPEVEAVEKYLKEGGRALILREPRTTTGLEEVLERYGLKAGGDVVVDVNPMSRILGGSADAPVIYEYGVHPITKDLQGLATYFPTVGSVETVAPAEPDVTTSALAHTSARSWGEMGKLVGQVKFDSGEDKPGPRDIAAAAVQKHGEEPAADPDAEQAGEQEEGEKKESAVKETRLVLFADADYAANSAFMAAGNKDLFLNTLAWLNERSDLISIRPKRRASQPVVLTAWQARALMVYALVLSPAMMLVVGLGVYLRRRRL